MKSALLTIMLIALSAPCIAQNEVFLCVDETGKKEYKTTGLTKGCKKIDLPGITSLPAPPKVKPKGPVHIGMKPQEAIKAWGRPYDVHRTRSASGTREQWVYGNSHYLYFDNGVLTVIQD